jgi:hypothetical protein
MIVRDKHRHNLTPSLHLCVDNMTAMPYQHSTYSWFGGILQLSSRSRHSQPTFPCKSGAQRQVNATAESMVQRYPALLMMPYGGAKPWHRLSSQ